MQILTLQAINPTSKVNAELKRKTGRPIVKLIFVPLIALSSAAMLAQHIPQQTDIAADPQQTIAAPASQNTADLLKAVDQLIDQNRKLADENRQISVQNQHLIEEVEQLRQLVVSANPTVPPPYAQNPASQRAEAQAERQTTSESGAASNKDLAIEESQPAGPKIWAPYTPNFGFKVANTPYGDLSISLFAYARYLNQRAVQSTYTNYFGNMVNQQQRQDFQLNKAQFKFLGWIMNPRLRYFLYTWSANSSQGQGAQVIVGGNLSYTFARFLTLSLGINGLPGVRTLEGNFPFWTSLDVRQQADEFFRPSYTQGIYGRGTIVKRLTYQAMLGNNLSNLGVSAAQLPHSFNTFAGALVWTPTTGEYGAGFGDFENHEAVATRFGAHFTRSDENKQSQPNTDQFDNTQIRLEDGTVVFTPGIFAPTTVVTDVRYKMMNVDSGMKYRGFELYGGYYQRWLNHFSGPGIGSQGLPEIVSRGFNLETSYMLKKELLMLYVGGSAVYGHYGHPWDFRTGLNYYPFRNRVVRWNNEFLYVNKSATGNNSITYTIGNTGPIFSTAFELAF